jgi:hypothetical protein
MLNICRIQSPVNTLVPAMNIFAILITTITLLASPAVATNVSSQNATSHLEHAKRYAQGRCSFQLQALQYCNSNNGLYITILKLPEIRDAQNETITLVGESEDDSPLWKKKSCGGNGGMKDEFKAEWSANRIWYTYGGCTWNSKDHNNLGEHCGGCRVGKWTEDPLRCGSSRVSVEISCMILQIFPKRWLTDPRYGLLFRLLDKRLFSIRLRDTNARRRS